MDTIDAPRLLNVLIRDDTAVKIGGVPKYRSVQVLLTNEQNAALQLHANEHIDAAELL